MQQPRLCYISVAAGLRFYKLLNVAVDPFLQMKLKLTNFSHFPDMVWNTVPLLCSPETVAFLRKCELSVGNNDSIRPVVSAHDVAQVLGLT